MAESGKVEEDPDHNVKDAAKDFACKIERSKRDFFVRIHDICKKYEGLAHDGEGSTIEEYIRSREQDSSDLARYGYDSSDSVSSGTGARDMDYSYAPPDPNFTKRAVEYFQVFCDAPEDDREVEMTSDDCDNGLVTEVETDFNVDFSLSDHSDRKEVTDLNSEKPRSPKLPKCDSFVVINLDDSDGEDSEQNERIVTKRKVRQRKGRRRSDHQQPKPKKRNIVNDSDEEAGIHGDDERDDGDIIPSKDICVLCSDDGWIKSIPLSKKTSEVQSLVLDDVRRCSHTENSQPNSVLLDTEIHYTTYDTNQTTYDTSHNGCCSTVVCSCPGYGVPHFPSCTCMSTWAPLTYHGQHILESTGLPSVPLLQHQPFTIDAEIQT